MPSELLNSKQKLMIIIIINRIANVGIEMKQKAVQQIGTKWDRLYELRKDGGRRLATNIRLETIRLELWQWSKFDHSDKQYMHKVETVLGNGTHKILRKFDI